MKKKKDNYGIKINSFIQKMNDLIDDQKEIDLENNKEKIVNYMNFEQIKQETMRKIENKTNSKLARQKNEINCKK